MGYDTAVLRHHDGTYENIARIEGNKQYLSVMRALATGPKQRSPDNFKDISDNWELLRYLSRRAKRLANKALGLPASPEVAALAGMLKQLHQAVAEVSKVDAVVLASPDRILLTYEEIGDVFDAPSVDSVKDGLHYDQRLYSFLAGYDGFGDGLCADYLNVDTCWDQEDELPIHQLVHIDFSEHSLGLAIGPAFLADG